MASIEKRRRTDGAWQYRVKIRVKGAPTGSASFERLTDARRWAQITETAIREGRHFRKAEAKKHTLAMAIDRYAEEVLPHKAKGGANQTAQFAWWRSQLGAYVLADITPALVAEYRGRLQRLPIDPRVKRPSKDATPRMRANATVVRYLAALSHVLSVSVKEWGWLEVNPVANVRKPKEERGRERFLSDNERQRLLDAAVVYGPSFYTLIVLALSTGMRRGEMLSLRWSQIDFQRGRITLLKTKNGEIRVVPLAGKAHELLLQLAKVRKIDCELVFSGEVAGRPFCMQKPWYASLKAAGISNFRFHDLRHSAASYMAMNGASMLDIAAVLGHKTLSMVKRYSHLSDDHTQRVVTSMNERIFAANSGEGRHG
ncbi:MAG: tyrosine-type recombinase/integrase [Rhodocyclaceae bacterium]|nr:tyrosine-type recombinase/integrase [Rhodocyclaceae bacterium]MBX3678053.1 tyrosine-type recombinase/integrase [Rhodocyclaceae bacterium]